METGVPAGLPVPAPLSRRKSSIWLWALAGVFGMGFLLFLALLVFSISLGDRGTAFSFGKQVGVLEIEGMILDSKDFIDDLRAFVRQDRVSAIVIRIDSPGGGVVPSQEMFSEILKAREKKKIVASMGSLAASGGYYIAAAADTIVASPGTITGSIGVLMKFVDIQQLQQFLKLRSYTLKSGPFKDMGSPTRTLSEEEEKIFQHLIDDMRNQFVEDIARGRKMDVAKVSQLADGRIYSGKEAQQLGLVDEIGGLQDAIELAGKLAGIQGEPELLYPEAKRRHWTDLLLGDRFEGLFLERLRGWSFEFPFFFSVIS